MTLLRPGDEPGGARETKNAGHSLAQTEAHMVIRLAPNPNRDNLGPMNAPPPLQHPKMNR